MNASELHAMISDRQIHRIFRAGACPVLELTVNYPFLEQEGTAANRFNETYFGLGEKLLEWTQETLLKTALADYESAGMGAAYRFDRRFLLCDMRAFPMDTADGGEVTFLRVTRLLQTGSRRGGVTERQVSSEDIWRWPELTLERASPRRKFRLFFGKNVKSY